MAYMRDKYYVWQDGENIHLPGEMDLESFDELVVMRYAQLEKKSRVQETEQRAATKHDGNLSCDPLLEKLGKKTAWESIMEGLENNNEA